MTLLVCLLNQCTLVVLSFYKKVEYDLAGGHSPEWD